MEQLPRDAESSLHGSIYGDFKIAELTAGRIRRWPNVTRSKKPI